MQRTVLSRFEVCVVTAVVEGDRVQGETAGPVLRCYSLEELEQLHARAVEEVAAANAVNRSSRRRSKGSSS